MTDIVERIVNLTAGEILNLTAADIQREFGLDLTGIAQFQEVAEDNDCQVAPTDVGVAVVRT